MERKSVEQMEQRILVAGNEDKDLQILAKPLAERGYGVTTTSGGRGAIDAIRSNPPDLVLIDTEMAEMNGYEVCEQLKSADLPGDIPVIFVAASDTSVDKARVFRTGGSDYITRPFEFPEIEARVRTHLELRRQRQELEQSQARLKETERLRDNLVHMLAHDLRNSLTAISGYLELIGLTGREALSEKTLEYVRKGTDSVSALVGALNTMIDVNKMEAGTMKLNLTRFDIVPFIKRLLSGSELSKGRTELMLDAPGTRVEVMADQDLIQRVVRSLLANAFKSAGKTGSVRVGVEDRQACIKVTIEDNGPTISPDLLGKIFDKFGQAEGNSGSKTYSQGLGFAFCRLATEAHGGRVGAESTANGTVFWFELTKNR